MKLPTELGPDPSWITVKSATINDRFKQSRLDLILGAILCAVTLFAFWPTQSNGFINYDDPSYITENPHVLTGLTWRNVQWAFTTTHFSNWTPITWLSHMLDVQLFGVNPRGHHLFNLVLHILCALLLFCLLRRLTSASWRSFFVAAFFALHPLHVESVAWASERKDVLSTLFFLLTILAYAKYVSAASSPGQLQVNARGVAPAQRARLFYFLALGFYALGLMSKPMLVTLPFLLLLLDFWPLGRLALNRQLETRTAARLLIEKVPFLLLAAASSIVTILAQTKSYSMLGGLPFPLRLATAIETCLTYLGKTVWPTGLAVFYPDPNARFFAPHSNPFYPVSELWPAWHIVCAGIWLAAVSVLVFLRREKEPWLFTGWFWFLGLLVPVIGIIQAGTQVMADRYTYLPLTGVFIACVWGVASLIQYRAALRMSVRLIGAALLAVCAVLTQQQVRYWKATDTLFGHALEVTTRNPMAEWMVGAACASHGQFGLAQTHFRLALAADPYQVEAHSALGSLFELQGRTDLATNEYTATLRMKPHDEFARIHLAGILLKLGKPDEALAQYEQAVRWNPESVEANFQAGNLLLDKGQLDRAAAFLQAALRLKPNHGEALLSLSDLRAQQGRSIEALAALTEVVRLYPSNFQLRVNLGSMLWKAGEHNDAIREYQEALRLNPAHPMIHYNLGTTFLLQGKLAEAKAELTEALRLKPDYPEAACDLGRVLAAEGSFNEALARFERGLKLAPDSPKLLSHLGWFLATCPDSQLRNGSRALELARRATELDSRGPAGWAALDAAYAETGDFGAAIQAAEKARALAVSKGDAQTAQAAENRINAYRERHVFRQ